MKLFDNIFMLWIVVVGDIKMETLESCYRAIYNKPECWSYYKKNFSSEIEYPGRRVSRLGEPHPRDDRRAVPRGRRDLRVCLLRSQPGGLPLAVEQVRIYFRKFWNSSL